MADAEPFTREHLRAVARRLRELDDRIDTARGDHHTVPARDALDAADPRPVQRREDLDDAALVLEHPESALELLTVDELDFLELVGQLAPIANRIVGHGPGSDADRGEISHRIHILQEWAMAQAAGRAYPGRFRVMGESR